LGTVAACEKRKKHNIDMMMHALRAKPTRSR